MPVLASSRLYPQKPITSKASGNLHKHKPFVEWTGFRTGNVFRELSEADQTVYLEGIWDGYIFALSFAGELPAAVQTLTDCIPHLRSDQLLAIVNKYMQEHPERWGDPMGVIVFDALPKQCWDF